MKRTVRPLVFGDWQHIVEQWHSSVPPLVPDDLAFYLVRNPNTSLVCIENTQLCGVVLAGHDGWRGYIRWLALTGSNAKDQQAIAVELFTALWRHLGQDGIAVCQVDGFTLPFGLDWPAMGWRTIPNTTDQTILQYNLAQQTVAPKGLSGCLSCPIADRGPRITSLAEDN